jgi:hypothetical protein
MSAAATAAGYLYASGRLRGRGAREGTESERQPERDARPLRRREVKVAVYAPDLQAAADDSLSAARPVRTPKIEYRTRRWRPSE